MKFVKVKEVPEKARGHKSLLTKWDEFMAMNVKVVKVDFDEDDYKNADIARSTMAMSIKRSGHPITITKRGDEIYLIRRDM